MVKVENGRVFSMLSFETLDHMLNSIRSLQDRFEIYDVDFDGYTFWILCGDAK